MIADNVCVMDLTKILRQFSQKVTEKVSSIVVITVITADHG